MYLRHFKVAKEVTFPKPSYKFFWAVRPFKEGCFLKIDLAALKGNFNYVVYLCLINGKSVANLVAASPFGVMLALLTGTMFAQHNLGHIPHFYWACQSQVWTSKKVVVGTTHPFWFSCDSAQCQEYHIVYLKHLLSLLSWETPKEL